MRCPQHVSGKPRGSDNVADVNFALRMSTTKRARRQLVVCPETDFTLLDFVEDGVDSGAPHERLRVRVVVPQVVFDGHDQFLHAAKDGSPQTGVGGLGQGRTDGPASGMALRIGDPPGRRPVLLRAKRPGRPRPAAARTAGLPGRTARLPRHAGHARASVRWNPWDDAPRGSFQGATAG